MRSTTLMAITFTSSLIVTATATQAQNLSDRIDHVMQQKVKAQTQNATKAQLLGTLLYTDITVQFNDQPSRDVMKYLQTVLGVNIVARYSDDKNANGSGIDPEQHITLDVTSKPALSVLEMVLDQCGGDSPQAVCTWQLREGYIEVGPKERLNAAREIRYYPIKDMLFEAPHFNNAPDLDLNTALNQAQNNGGGGGGGGGGGRGGSGGGGGGGSGGGGGRGVFGEPKGEPERTSEAERAQEVLNLITEIVEPEAWESAGGSAASIRYYQGVLIVRAPDYIHRQIGGYPFAIRPVGPQASAMLDNRYVTFSSSFSSVNLDGFRTSGLLGGAAGGGSNASGALPAKSGSKSGSKPSTGGAAPAKP